MVLASIHTGKKKIGVCESSMLLKNMVLSGNWTALLTCVTEQSMLTITEHLIRCQFLFAIVDVLILILTCLILLVIPRVELSTFTNTAQIAMHAHASYIFSYLLERFR